MTSTLKNKKIKANTFFFCIIAVTTALFILFISALIFTWPTYSNSASPGLEAVPDDDYSVNLAGSQARGAIDDETRSLQLAILEQALKREQEYVPESAQDTIISHPINNGADELEGLENGLDFTLAPPIHQRPKARNRQNSYHQSIRGDNEAYSNMLMNDEVNPHNKNEKIILLWTAWWGDRTWQKIFKRNGGPFVRLPPAVNDNGDVVQRRSCRLSVNRTLQKYASSFVFHSFDIQPNKFDDVPDVRYPSQVWVFWMIEPPPRSGLLNNHDWDRANAMEFNMTMSYLRSADVWFPYGRIYEYPIDTRRHLAKTVKHRVDNFVKEFPTRNVDGVWIVSDCSTYSGREELVKQIKLAGISVDSWGNCSHNSPDREWEHFGRSKFFTQYRFYFAFENTFCDDYVSEKAFIAMNMSRYYGLIPVVYGAARYSTILPPGSFIDARAFDSVADLARFMRELSHPQNEEKLRSYFNWQFKYFTDKNENSRVVMGWQSLCQSLWDWDLNGKLNNGVTIRNLRARMGECNL